MSKEAVMFDTLWRKYYVNHLIHECHLETSITKYGRAFDVLHSVPFRPLLPRDRNREEDGLKMRRDFLFPSYISKNRNVREMFENAPCSCFEVICGLAFRFEDDYAGTPGGLRPEIWITRMIDNLGLTKMRRTSNGVFRSLTNEEMERKIDRWLDRKYSSNGCGGLFPLRDDDRDQREVEMWDQIIAYAHENRFWDD